MASKQRQELETWFKSHNGYISPSIELTWDKDSGQHFQAITSLAGAETEVLCACPHRLTLSYLNVLANPQVAVEDHSGTSPCAHLVGKVSASTIGYFFLAEQRLKGEDGFWWPYVRSLPREDSLCTPLWFHDDDLIWLAGTTLHSSMVDPSKSAVMARKQAWLNEWTSGREILRKQGVDVEPFTWEVFLWAATIFTSRAFASTVTIPGVDTGESFSLLYPVIDSFNHRFGAKVVWNMDNGSFSLSTTEPIQKGQQVYNNYAPKGNEELLLGYGFCLPDNPCDQFALRLGRPPDEVLEALHERFPVQFPTSEWTQDAARFFLRGSRHYSGGYGHEIPNLRGIPPELFGAVSGIISYSNGDMDEEDIVDATIQALLDRVRAMRLAIAQWDSNLPPEPQNLKQTFAKIYRDGQITIAEEVIKELEDYFV